MLFANIKSLDFNHKLLNIKLKVKVEQIEYWTNFKAKIEQIWSWTTKFSQPCIKHSFQNSNLKHASASLAANKFPRLTTLEQYIHLLVSLVLQTPHIENCESMLHVNVHYPWHVWIRSHHHSTEYVIFIIILNTLLKINLQEHFFQPIKKHPFQHSNRM